MSVEQPLNPGEVIEPVIPHSDPMVGTASLELAQSKNPNRIKDFFKLLGPGLVTGACDDDPSGIGTYAQAGASLGFATLWLAVFTFPLMASVQFICAKIGMVSGRGLAGVLRRYYPRWVLFPAITMLVVANTINAGADLGAVAAAINLIVPIPVIWLIAPVAFLILILQIWGSYQLISKIFKWLTLALFTYIGAAILAKPDWDEVLKATLVPTFRFDSTFLSMLVAILGTSISPYLFFWQADQEVEEEISMGRRTLKQRKGATNQELKYASTDVNIGMFFSNLVMYFIILATAATLFKAGKTNIQSATDAALALQPIAGDSATILLALGLIGSGLLAVPVLTGSVGYAVAEGFGWKYGLDEKPKSARKFYTIIAASTLVGMGMNFIGISPISALFWTAIINGFLAPPLLVLLMLVANNRRVLGTRVNSLGLNIMGWLTTILMFLAAIAMVITASQ